MSRVFKNLQEVPVKNLWRHCDYWMQDLCNDYEHCGAHPRCLVAKKELKQRWMDDIGEAMKVAGYYPKDSRECPNCWDSMEKQFKCETCHGKGFVEKHVSFGHRLRESPYWKDTDATKGEVP